MNHQTPLMSNVQRDMRDLHPIAAKQFLALQEALQRAVIDGETTIAFLPFEVYRHPQRQRWLKEQGARVTNADMYQSAHQFGLAVDFVPFVNGKWTWADNMPWSFLKKKAMQHGLTVPMTWDQAHVESPYWADFRDTMRRM